MAQPGDSKTPLLADGGQPLVLVGPPTAIRGQFRVRNATDSKIIVRQPMLRAAAPTASRAKAAAIKAAPLPDAALALRRIVVRAGQSRPVPIALALDPTTPPGTYHAQLEIEGEQRNVVLHVIEDVSLEVMPQELVLPSRAGEKVEKQVVFSNTGNVPVNVKTIGTVVLDSELAHCRALRGALSDVGDTLKGLDDFVVALGKRYKAIYETLALKVQHDKLTLAPGETQAVTLTITIPDKLDPRSRYTGYAAISTSNLTFTVVPD
jgi:hypothetical protein